MLLPHYGGYTHWCRWALFPPGTPRHVVLPREEGIEKEAVSWFTHVYPRTQRADWPTARPIDIIQVGYTSCVQVQHTSSNRNTYSDNHLMNDVSWSDF